MRHTACGQSSLACAPGQEAACLGFSVPAYRRCSTSCTSPRRRQLGQTAGATGQVGPAHPQRVLHGPDCRAQTQRFTRTVGHSGLDEHPPQAPVAHPSHPRRAGRRAVFVAARALPHLVRSGLTPEMVGVDASASNDGAHMVNQGRQARLLARVGCALSAPATRDGQTFFCCDFGPADMTVRNALYIATRGAPRC